MIHRRTLHSLEFTKVIERLAALCLSTNGKKRARGILPLPDAEAVDRARALYEESGTWMAAPETERNFRFSAFTDVEGLLDAAQGSRFSPDTEAFWALRDMLGKAKSAHESITLASDVRDWPNLYELVKSRPLPVQLTAALFRCISDDALIKDESSPELYRLRGEIRALHRNCMNKVKDFAVQYNFAAYLQDEFMTLSQDRYVLPLKATYKARMQGIIHDWSQTGETCYFEPIFLVELNNRLQELKHEEHDEEQKVLDYLRRLLLAELDAASGALDLLTELDILQAKHALSERFDGRMIPLSPADEGIYLKRARHPLLALFSADDQMGRRNQPIPKVHPLDIILRPGERCLVVTGGNAGGKTVCLKTLGLITAMALSGLPVPVDGGSHLPWCDRMDAFIGDEQSLDASVSTFTAQIDHLAKAWKHLNERSIVLLDEFGAGTDPAQGAALAQAVLEEMLVRKTFVLAATHFPALKTWSLTNADARAASMLFDPTTKRPLFRLAYDQVGASQALATAREHGLPEEILQRAEKYLLQAGHDTEGLLDRLNALAARREKELQSLDAEREKLRADTQRQRDTLKKTREKLLEEVREKAQELMRAWKEGRATAKQSLKEMSCLRASLVPEKKAQGGQTLLAPCDKPVVGQRVLHAAFRKHGVITDIDERRGRVRLDMGGVSLWAQMSDVMIAAGPPNKPLSGATVVNTAREGASLRLDVRGQRTENALHELSRFLDKAVLAGFENIEVVHGRGTGALRREIHSFLRTCPSVASFALASEDHGGDGMTEVRLR
ncbi:MAG: Smr/MutS family protein [Desulfovibrio sp.]|nr:Smr/MutS family protein [Desulfovibrio sp.]